MRRKAKPLLSYVVLLFDCLFVVCLVGLAGVCLFVCLFVCVCGGGCFVVVVYSGHACSVSFKPMIIGCHYCNASIKF